MLLRFSDDSITGFGNFEFSVLLRKILFRLGYDTTQLKDFEIFT